MTNSRMYLARHNIHHRPDFRSSRKKETIELIQHRHLLAETRLPSVPNKAVRPHMPFSFRQLLHLQPPPQPTISPADFRLNNPCNSNAKQRHNTSHLQHTHTQPTKSPRRPSPGTESRAWSGPRHSRYDIFPPTRKGVQEMRAVCGWQS